MWQVKHFSRDIEVERFLNGNLDGSVNLINGANVDGLTFIVDVGSGNVTVTFAPAKSRDWTLREIVDKINATSGLEGVAQAFAKTKHMLHNTGDVRLSIVSDTATVSNTGTANSALGYPTGAPLVLSAVAAADIKAADFETNNNGQKEWTLLVNV